MWIIFRSGTACAAMFSLSGARNPMALPSLDNQRDSVSGLDPLPVVATNEAFVADPHVSPCSEVDELH